MFVSEAEKDHLVAKDRRDDRQAHKAHVAERRHEPGRATSSLRVRSSRGRNHATAICKTVAAVITRT